jgi:hypothetical protein
MLFPPARPFPGSNSRRVAPFAPAALPPPPWRGWLRPRHTTLCTRWGRAPWPVENAPRCRPSAPSLRPALRPALLLARPRSHARRSPSPSSRGTPTYPSPPFLPPSLPPALGPSHVAPGPSSPAGRGPWRARLYWRRMPP